ncbi:MAG: TolC family protein [Stomatobaculum sp.]|nr:TolC family protein [Stomatobaculum sp.]
MYIDRDNTRKKVHSRHALRFGTALCLTMSLCAGTAVPVLAYITAPQSPEDRGKSVAELNGYSEERWGQLMDDRLEYEEIRDLVHNFNPTIVSAWANLTDNTNLLDRIVDDLDAGQRDMERLKSNAKDNKDYEGYGNYAMQEAILKASSKAFHDSAEKMKRPVTATNRPLRAAERQLTAGVQQLMIAYGSLMEQRAIVAESAAMYEKLLSDANARLSVGMGTATDVQSAQTSFLQAQSQLSSIDAAAWQLKKNLILLCGWSAGADPEIGPVPEPDPARIDGMNPDADLTKAIAHSQDIINFRNEDHSLSTYSKNVRHETEESMNQGLLVNLRTQYQSVLAAKESWEAAKSGLQAAEISKNAADMQYQMGMLSTAQYLGALTQYQSAKTAMVTASSTFFQAMETYDWMLDGVSSVE